jgi:dethiobiotin synthetase
VSGLLITGTDTGVGKTVVAAGLVAWARRLGPVAPWKPVESGTAENGGVPADGALLAECAGVTLESVNVFALGEPLAPVVAARRAGVSLEVEVLDAGAGRLADRGLPIVEGVGGALVEVCPGVMVADLPQRWGLRALVVAGNRLGVLSHTLLTVEALLARGAVVAGVVLNTLHDGEPTTAESTNAAELERTLPAGADLLGVVPFVSDRRPEALAAAVAPIAELLFVGRMDAGHDAPRTR